MIFITALKSKNKIHGEDTYWIHTSSASELTTLMDGRTNGRSVRPPVRLSIKGIYISFELLSRLSSCNNYGRFQVQVQVSHGGIFGTNRWWTDALCVAVLCRCARKKDSQTYSSLYTGWFVLIRGFLAAGRSSLDTWSYTPAAERLFLTIVFRCATWNHKQAAVALTFRTTCGLVSSDKDQTTRDVTKAGSLKAKAKVKSLKAKARSLKAKTE